MTGLAVPIRSNLLHGFPALALIPAPNQSMNAPVGLFENFSGLA